MATRRNTAAEFWRDGEKSETEDLRDFFENSFSALFDTDCDFDINHNHPEPTTQRNRPSVWFDRATVEHLIGEDKNGCT